MNLNVDPFHRFFRCPTPRPRIPFERRGKPSIRRVEKNILSKTFGGIVETIFFSFFLSFCKSYVNEQRRKKGREREKRNQRGVVEFQKFRVSEFVFSCTVPRFLQEKPRGSLSGKFTGSKGDRNFGIL